MEHRWTQRFVLEKGVENKSLGLGMKEDLRWLEVRAGGSIDGDDSGDSREVAIREIEVFSALIFKIEFMC